LRQVERGLCPAQVRRSHADPSTEDSIKGVVITNVDSSSDAAEKRLSAGEVIVEVAQEAVSNAADVKKRVEQLKKDGKKSILLLVSNADGELRFVALSVQ